MNFSNILQDSVGKKVYIKRKSTPSYTIVGIVQDLDENKVFVVSEKDSYVVDFDDVLSLDIKESTTYNQSKYLG